MDNEIPLKKIKEIRSKENNDHHIPEWLLLLKIQYKKSRRELENSKTI